MNGSDFQAFCVTLLDKLRKERVVGIEHGQPVANPIVEETSAHLIGSLTRKYKVLGDTMSTGIEWEADT
jgi:hypothetical protein